MNWDALSESAHERARVRAWRRRLSVDESTDVAQDALAELVRLDRLRRGPDNPVGWLFCAIDRRVIDRIRRRSAGHDVGVWNAVSIDATADSYALDSNVADPAVAAETHDEARIALAWLFDLPAPYRQIATAQCLRDWSRREIIAWLQSWRPVGLGCCRRLIDRTHELLRAMGDGGTTPRARWPKRFTPDTNPWMCSPPPPLVRHT